MKKLLQYILFIVMVNVMLFSFIVAAFPHDVEKEKQYQKIKEIQEQREKFYKCENS